MRLATLALVVAGALALGGGNGKADTVSAIQGHGWPNHFDGCFGSSWQIMQNNCSMTRLLIIPAQGRYWGYSQIWVAASGNGGSGSTAMTNCQGISSSVSSSGMFADDFTPIVSTGTASSFTGLNLGNLFLWPGSVMHFECFVAGFGGRVASFDFE